MHQATLIFSQQHNRRFPEITGKDNLTVFSYSGRVKSPEWRRQLRRADLRQFQIFRHGPIIIYARLPAGGTCYPICMFPTNGECLIGISDAFSAFVYGYPSSCPRAHCTPQQKRDYSALHPQAWTCIYTGHACRHLPSAAQWISDYRLLYLIPVTRVSGGICMHPMCYKTCHQPRALQF